MTMQESARIRRAAVLGAGVMGSQIAAHLANAQVEVILFEMPGPAGDKSGPAKKALAQLTKMDPAPLAVPERASALFPANYDEHLPLLASCDFVIEAVAERYDIKTALLSRVASFLPPHAVLATNTSGLSPGRLAEALPAAVRSRFLGVHFFNPPRYMSLCELIPTADTDPGVVDAMESFVASRMGKNVLRAKDTPNFIANRVGVFATLATLHHAMRLQTPFDVVDALTGPALGRPKTATFRTLDLVGLDVFAEVVRNMYENLADDPWRHLFVLPDWLRAMVTQGALGKKAGRGFYEKKGDAVRVFSPQAGGYVESRAEVDASVAALLAERDPEKGLRGILASRHPHAELITASLRDLFHYCAAMTADIAYTTSDVDNAMKWGFGWARGPFELWNALGWNETAAWLGEQISSGKALASKPLPDWVGRMSALSKGDASFSPATGDYEAPRELPVYERYMREEKRSGRTVRETPTTRLWDAGDGIAVLGFKTKMHVVSEGVVADVVEAVGEAERGFRGMVIWQGEAPFSAGANLKELLTILDKGDMEGVRRAVRHFQSGVQRMRYAHVPVVAAVEGLALGGGCEIVMHSASAVAALETYMGLVEAGAGLIPAGGGSKEFACRIAAERGDLLAPLGRVFQNVAQAKVAKSAEEARAMGFLRPQDRIVMQSGELLHAAKHHAIGLAESGYVPPLPHRGVRVAGRNGIAALSLMVENLKAGGFATEHDARVARHFAYVLCGGDVETGSLVTEEWLLKLEEDAFVELCSTPETRARMDYLMKNGKPLRN